MMLSRRTFVASSTALMLAGCSRKKAEQGGALILQSSWINDAEFLGYFVALDDDNAFYEKLGLKLEYRSGGPQIIPESALLSNQAHVALTTPETTAQYILRDGMDLRIIGTQYQKNPIGIVSLERNPIDSVPALVGKRLAVAPVNRPTVDAILAKFKIDPKSVDIVPYTYDHKILLSGAVDATIDFVTNVPFAIKRDGGEPHSLLLYDIGHTIYNDTIVVTRKVLEERFEDLARFLAGSMLGWEENYKKPFDHYPKKYRNTWYKGNGRTVENETEFNQNQKALMESPNGYFDMSVNGIQANIAALRELKLDLPASIFDPRPLARAKELRANLLAGKV